VNGVAGVCREGGSTLPMIAKAAKEAVTPTCPRRTPLPSSDLPISAYRMLTAIASVHAFKLFLF
jgi:hypothetical protein